ncbi:hypothetical protein, partial [Marinobacter alexandrii]|uniref:hypothetical protein n=1 Tax=Marinobacter alexandrii TaxID=2570351 RepID=UPI00329704E0
NKRVDIRGNGSGTHSLIRGMWPTWCKRLGAISVFERLKVTQTVSLKDVWNAMGVESLAESGLLVWGYELTNLSKDHSSRNIASYEVRQTYEGIFPAQSEGKHRLLSLVWEHLAPGGIDGQLRFEVLYAQYLIWGYAKQFANSEEFEDSQQEYDRNFARIINNISENCGVSSDLLDALLRVDIAGDPLFEVFDLASQRDAGTENIFSRAFILTRLATCRLNDSIEISRCGAVQAWIQKWLFELGVMKIGETPEDVTDSAEELIEKASSVSDERQSDLWPTCAADAAEASRLNIALCWGLSLQS